MTNEEKVELQALKEKIPGWAIYHIGRDYNGEEVSIQEVKNLRRLSFLLGKEEESNEKLSKTVTFLCQARSFEKGMEAQKEKDKEAVKVKENLFSTDPGIVLSQILNALNKGPLTYSNVKIVLKNLIKHIPSTIRIVLEELKFEENSDFEEGAEAAFINFIDNSETDEDDIIKLTNQLIDIAFGNISGDGEKEIVKHAVEEMS
jgi:hypothetical protein